MVEPGYSAGFAGALVFVGDAWSETRKSGGFDQAVRATAKTRQEQAEKDAFSESGWPS
jgi:hypothetical protein